MLEIILLLSSFCIVLVIFVALCCKEPEEEPIVEPPVKKTEAFMDNLEEISENVAFHVIANSNKNVGRNALVNTGLPPESSEPPPVIDA